MFKPEQYTTIQFEKDKAGSYYPESFAKVNNGSLKYNRNKFNTSYNENKAILKEILDQGLTLSCTAGYIQGGCSKGTNYLKAVFCGKEWCENCGQDGSPVHLRRLGRWIPKADQFKNLGYLVITIPEEARQFFKDKKSLTEFRTYIKRKLQRDGYDKGLIRYHYFGDCKSCKSEGCRYCRFTGINAKYHPHLNVIVDSGFIKKSEFEKYAEYFRADLSKFFEKKTKLKGLEGNLHYSYVKGTNSAKKMHLLKYVTRSTHRNYVKEIAENLKGFRTTSCWGKYDHKVEVKTENSDLVNLTNGKCLCCGEKIKWDTGYYVTDLVTGQMKYKRTIIKPDKIPINIKHITAGYYIINQ